ncbi:methyltransferase domain-containing protein [Allobranchiibius sp. GilTou38]|uniref:TRM11 family SAM-dependent methyltransferase n=1 Tax=Allobranchiibius sp. GilTou38 TaxID=2815210 RepID=UPI001AA1B3D3|nr:methyltransferase domain-containing protein [Allobranchiibius sp. GilTou38]MBO1768016.1 methyltransferase domain-containing protein [Allobranchiibius sp. GilTou38]
MPVDLIVTCAVGFEDLFRGDLLQEHGIRSRSIEPGEILLQHVEDLGFLTSAVALDRVALPWDPDAPSDVIADVVRRLAERVGIEQPVRFRVQAAPDVREELIARFSDGAVWVNAPSDWQVNLDVERGVAQLGPLAWAARFGTLRRLPAATPVSVVAGLLRLAKCAPHDVLLDPCAGVATVPIVDAIDRPDGRCIGLDQDVEAIDLARRNLAERGLDGRIEVFVGDAARLDLADRSVDRVVTDLPFGKRIGSNSNNIELYPRVLREIERVLAPSGRCVLLTDDKRIFKDALARTRGLKIVREQVVRYHGVNPSAYVVTRSRTPGRRAR